MSADTFDFGAALQDIGDRCRFTGYCYAISDVVTAVTGLAQAGQEVNARMVLDIAAQLSNASTQTRASDGGYALPARQG